MKERLSLRVDDHGLVAQHRFRVFGLPFLELTYRIRPKQRDVGDRLVAQARACTENGAPGT